MMLTLNSEIFTHDCDLQHPNSLAWQPSSPLAFHPLFCFVLFFLRGECLSVINDSVDVEWCFWFDPKKGPPLFFQVF